jgi:hypothetical protein
LEIQISEDFFKFNPKESLELTQKFRERIFGKISEGSPSVKLIATSPLTSVGGEHGEIGHIELENTVSSKNTVSPISLSGIKGVRLLAEIASELSQKQGDIEKAQNKLNSEFAQKKKLWEEYVNGKVPEPGDADFQNKLVRPLKEKGEGRREELKKNTKRDGQKERDAEEKKITESNNALSVSDPAKFKEAVKELLKTLKSPENSNDSKQKKDNESGEKEKNEAHIENVATAAQWLVYDFKKSKKSIEDRNNEKEELNFQLQQSEAFWSNPLSHLRISVFANDPNNNTTGEKEVLRFVFPPSQSQEP